MATVNGGDLYYIDFAQDQFHLGGSSFAQSLDRIGKETPSVQDARYFKKAFNAVQDHISNRKINAGHDIGSGGLITTLLELCFASNSGNVKIISINYFFCFNSKTFSNSNKILEKIGMNLFCGVWITIMVE